MSRLDASTRPGRSAPKPVQGIDQPIASLFAAIRPLLDAKEGIVLHVVAATAGEGASTIARALAVTAASLGHRRTLLLDGDRADPQLARSFGAVTDRGVIDCLWQQADYGQVLQTLENGMLSVGCLAAAGAGNAVDIDSLRALWSALRQRYELTILDCPPITGGAYTSLIPETADGIILVVQAEHTRPAVVARSRELLEQAGGTLIGAVLNKRRNYIPGFLYRAL